MPKVRAGADERWTRRTSAATQDYVAGIQAPREPWQKQTLAAGNAYKQAVIAAAQEARFERGVQKVSDAQWAERATKVGAGRFAPGVQDATATYQAATQKFRQVIEQTQLPPRGPKGDPRNLERVRVMAEAMRKARGA